MILIKNLYLRFIREYYALHDINLEIAAGEKTVFLGSKGSGKTTLLRVLARLEEPTDGEVYINNKQLSKINFKSDLSVGYVPVLPIYLKKKTVEENFAYILKQRKVGKEQAEQKIGEVLKQFGIENLKCVNFEKLSLYEKYVVSFARLALREVSLLLVDNIFEKLSEKEIEDIIKLMETHFLQNKDLTSVVATSSSLIAKRVGERNIYFKFGSIVNTKPEDVM